MSTVIRIIIAFVFLLSFSLPTYAVNPADAPNNKYGIHLTIPSDDDIRKAAELVNTNGGKWGYVTLVIQQEERNKDQWQSVFNKLREHKLIPIVRLGTKPDGGNWKRPSVDEAQEWADFLDSLNWVVKNRYIVLFNEPNHATEWGGSVDPKSFAEVNKAFAKKLKEKNSDFFIMMGGLDGAAPSQMPRYEDSGKFISAVMTHITADEYNQLFDGLSSHSYPNPGFVGSPYGSGKMSVRGYEYELNLLKSFGVKDLPVFITETGWNGKALSREQVAENFRIAYEEVWGPDPRIVAVTPFVINYQGEPFLQFSWLQKDTNEPYPEYYMVQNLPKNAGRPDFLEKGGISHNLPTELVAQSTFHFHFKLHNKGQPIWRDDDGYKLMIEDVDPARYLIPPIQQIKPMEDKDFDFYLTTGEQTGKKTKKIVLYRDDKKVLESKPWTYEIVPLPELQVNASLFPKLSSQGQDFELQVFDEHEELVFKQKNVVVKSSKALIPKVENIALNRKYRVVLLKKYYLPTQTYITFKKGDNEVRFKRMLPLDANGDGTLNFDDVGSAFMNPKLFLNWLP